MNFVSTQEKDFFTVAEVNFLLANALEKAYPKLKFEGEISEINHSKSGHIYFTIKDENACLSAVMWKSCVLALQFKPAVGNKVFCQGKPSVYSQNGRLQIIVQSMSLAGQGLLLAKLNELKAKLEKEGIFSDSRKRAIPRFPSSVGIVTSASGAVIHDIEVRIKARMPWIQLYLVDVKVQGEGASKEIAKAIGFLNRFEPKPGKKLDVLIVGRGGGSLEDLWAFNEEEVIRAIFASQIPVVSSVGHEVDYCLSDFVADTRAPTPTAAAEMISMDKNELLERVESLTLRLKNFERWLLPLTQKLDELNSRLGLSLKQVIKTAFLQIDSAIGKVMLLHPKERIKNLTQSLDYLNSKLRKALDYKLSNEEKKVDFLYRSLLNLNPKAVLKRGYALIEVDGKILTDSKNVVINQELVVSLAKGKLLSEVKKIYN